VPIFIDSFLLLWDRGGAISEESRRRKTIAPALDSSSFV
jgi:hypothetical protein